MRKALGIAILFCACFGMGMLILTGYYKIFNPTGFTKFEVFISFVLGIYIVMDMVDGVMKRIEESEKKEG